jgi:hypothetical protein
MSRQCHIKTIPTCARQDMPVMRMAQEQARGVIIAMLPLRHGVPMAGNFISEKENNV